MRHLVSRFFGNSRELLLLNLLEDQNLDDTELKKLRDMLQSGEKAK